MADLLQTGSPYSDNDAGASITLWHIYDDKGDWIWWNGETLNVRRLVADAGAPIIRSDFDVYRNGRWLIYINERCSEANLDNTFFLGVFPVNNDDLPESRDATSFTTWTLASRTTGLAAAKGASPCASFHDTLSNGFTPDSTYPRKTASITLGRATSSCPTNSHSLTH